MQRQAQAGREATIVGFLGPQTIVRVADGAVLVPEFVGVPVQDV